MSLKFGQIQPLVSTVTERVVMGKNGVSTFSRLFFIRSFLYLQVRITCMRAQKSSNFGLIGPPTAELAALEHLKNPHRLIMGKRCLHFFSDVPDRILFLLAGNDNIHKSLDEFEIWPDFTTGFHGNRCYSLKNGVAYFSRLFLMGSFFILTGNGDIHKS